MLTKVLSLHARLGFKYRLDRCIDYVRPFGVRDPIHTQGRISAQHRHIVVVNTSS